MTIVAVVDTAASMGAIAAICVAVFGYLTILYLYKIMGI